jgi:hypothetical protein
VRLFLRYRRWIRSLPSTAWNASVGRRLIGYYLVIRDAKHLTLCCSSSKLWSCALTAGGLSQWDLLKYLRDASRWCLNYFATMEMEAICSSETSVDFQRTTRRNSQKITALHNYRCVNLRSYITNLSSIWGCHNGATSLKIVPLRDLNRDCEVAIIFTQYSHRARNMNGRIPIFTFETEDIVTCKG